jgi:hypothetical protein
MLKSLMHLCRTTRQYFTHRCIAWRGILCSGELGGGRGGAHSVVSNPDAVTKLAYTDVRRSMALREALAQHHYGQFPFAPDINPRSRAIGKVRTCLLACFID